MGETHILRVSRVDDDGDYVLVQVTPNGRKDLDLKLVATDGLSPFVAELKQGRVSSLKEKKQPCSEDEWERILTEVLLDRQSDPEIEAAALVEPDQSVTLIVRRSISGIKQRIGSITLKYKEDEGIELFDWCGNAVEAKEQVKADLTAATAKVEELEKAVNELKDQLEELIEAKKADESELLEKFRDLLNEKKVKIREQQRMLMANDVDVSPSIKPEPRSQSQQKIPDTTKGRKPKPSRTSKRKAAEPEPEPEPEEEIPESDDELEKMEVDKRHGEEDSENDRATDDGATASEGDDDVDVDNDEPTRGTGQPPAANIRQASQNRSEAPPPPRTLPFSRAKQPTKPAAAKPDPTPAEGSETESDDEL